ncbi:MAG TPA: KUP/HAK/KT family potassium transporter, partial [Thermoanaerobaculia bacterium]|nr:KUP/HAK/KT family potassium transporter [Thermoanaerobaculia bacterium]
MSLSHEDGNHNLTRLALGALGVVYGDIGTSPLYAMRECFYGTHSVRPTPENVLGILSLIFWALIIIISIKYLVFVTRANNRGEGGILSLMSLIPAKTVGTGRKRSWLLMTLGLFGAALLYGDGMLTPTVTVLSAVEGLEEATTFFNPYVVPITIVILVGVFLLQRRGTAGIGAVFGPVMMLWFTTLAVLGVSWIWRHPEVLAAVNPAHAFSFFARNQGMGFLALGSVFLVVTGGEALYADMGHFGRRPIQVAWFIMVLPCLLLNYFGQGALLLSGTWTKGNPFYGLVPSWGLYPLVVLSTAAAIIASQA